MSVWCGVVCVMCVIWNDECVWCGVRVMCGICVCFSIVVQCILIGPNKPQSKLQW